MRALLQRIGLVIALALTGRTLAADNWDVAAAYQAREASLKAEVTAKPDDAQPLLDLAWFYMRPAAPREVRTMDGDTRTVMVPLRPARRIAVTRIIDNLWTYNGDPDLAKPLLEKALQLDAKNPAVLRQVAYYLRMKDALGSIEEYLKPAMQADSGDLDMVHIYFDWQMEMARQLNEQAEMLRQPTWLTEQRWGRTEKVLTPASPAAEADARELDAKADMCRSEAVRPLLELIHVLKNDPKLETDGKLRAKYFMAHTIYYYWKGQQNISAQAAGEALKADPTNADAVMYIVYGFAPFKQQPPYKALLEEWTGRPVAEPDQRQPSVKDSQPVKKRR